MFRMQNVTLIKRSHFYIELILSFVYFDLFKVSFEEMCVQNISCLIQAFPRPELSLMWVFSFWSREVAYVSSNLWECWSCQLQLVLSNLYCCVGQGAVWPRPSCCCSAGSSRGSSTAELAVPRAAPFLEALPQSWKCSCAFPAQNWEVQGPCPEHDPGPVPVPALVCAPGQG